MTPKFDPREKRYPVYATQGGGFVRPIGDVFVFVIDSDIPDLAIGDIMPTEWGIIPANEAAIEEMTNEQAS